jgi:hypothetical protein
MKPAFRAAAAFCLAVLAAAGEPPSPVRVSGRVVDLGANALVDVEVALNRAGQPEAALTARTGQNGGFEFSAVRPGDYELRVGPVGYEPLVKAFRVADKPVDLGALPLRLAMGGGPHVVRTVRVSGRLLDESTAAFEGLSVTLARPGQATTTKTDPDGAFEFPSVLPGDYALRSQAPGFHALVVPVHARTADLNLGALTLRVAPIVCPVIVVAPDVYRSAPLPDSLPSATPR